MSIKSNYIQYLLDKMPPEELFELARDALYYHLSSHTDYQLRTVIKEEHGVDVLQRLVS